MKAASPQLIAYLAAVRAGTQELKFADCFTWTLFTGDVLRYTTADLSQTVNGNTFSAASVLVEGMRYKASIGLSVDQQQITVYADATDLIVGGIPFMLAARQGWLDAARIVRERAFFTEWTAPPVGSVVLFKGILGTIDSFGRTSLQATVNSDLVYLDGQLPYNAFQTTCLHTVYDPGCGLARAAFTANGGAGEGSTVLGLVWSAVTGDYLQGSVMFTSGANKGQSRSVRAISGSVLALSAPLPYAPAPGDGFAISKGCDRTAATCTARFNNLANFRGFPYVPQAQFGA